MYDDKDLVVKTKIGLSGKSSPTGSGTSTLPRYEYILESPATSANPTTEQVEKIRHMEKVYMTVTAKQIIKGMKSEKKFRTTRQTLEAIPKHLFAISFNRVAAKPRCWMEGLQTGMGNLLCSGLGSEEDAHLDGDHLDNWTRRFRFVAVPHQPNRSSKRQCGIPHVGSGDEAGTCDTAVSRRGMINGFGVSKG